MVRVGFPQRSYWALLVALGLSHTAFAQPVIFDPPLSPRTANYRIDVRLDVETRALEASQTLTWHNQSRDTIRELQFHLYLNGFRNNRSTLFREGGYGRGTDFAEDEGWGVIEMSRIALPSGQDLTESAEFIWPDNDDEHDRTVLRLPLPGALAPGDSVVLDIDFDAILPTPPFRTGSKEEFFFVGQWYPKVGVYIDGAWNCHQFHSAAEFFADFGVYDVRMTVPGDHVLGATGSEVDVVRNDDGTATHYYHAEDVSDFAWTTSPEFVEFVTDTQGVEIRVLMQPDRVSQVDRYLRSAKVGLAYLQDWIGDYPYPSLTVVDPRRGAASAGGMEYPTLYTTIGVYGWGEGMRMVETTNFHEMVHQYFQHMVATNEFEEAWLDEGFATYLEDRIARDMYGPEGSMIDLFGIRVDNRHMFRAALADAGGYDRLARRSWEFYSEGIGAVNVYYKMALLLLTLENYLGEETMQQILRTYYHRWRFKHPHTQDLIDVVNEVAGQDLTWYFDQFLYTNGVLDYSVSRTRTKKIKDPEGYDFTMVPFEDDEAADDAVDEDSGTIIVDIDDTAADGDSAADGDNGDDGDDEEPEFYRSEVQVRRMGGLVFPVTIEVRFDDGEVVREQWDGREAWRRYLYVREARLVSATVDPDSLVPLDINFTNNSRTVEPEGLGVQKLCARIMFWAQFIMDQPEFLNIATLMDGMGLD